LNAQPVRRRELRIRMGLGHLCCVSGSQEGPAHSVTILVTIPSEWRSQVRNKTKQKFQAGMRPSRVLMGQVAVALEPVKLPAVQLLALGKSIVSLSLNILTCKIGLI
jgi:hypothetical protein